MNINDNKEFLLQPHLFLLILLGRHRQFLLQPLLQPLLQVVIMRAVTHLIVLTLLLQEQLQQMVREKSENIMNISEMK